MSQSVTAKVFRNGRSQAVRIPAEFRFKTDQVYIERDEATGIVTLSEEPPKKRSMADLFARVDAAGGFEFEIERDRRPPQEREPW
ncbi:MAG: antitoxin [Janthinobacterium lividum]